MAKLGTHSHHVRGLPVVQVRNVADVGSYEPVCDGVNLSFLANDAWLHMP